MDVELIDVNRVGWIDAFTNREHDLIALRHDELGPVVRRIVLVPVVADRRVVRCAERGGRVHDNSGDDHTDGSEALHVP